MNKLIILLLFIWLCLLTAATNNIATELSDLKARDRLRSMEIMALRSQNQLNNENTERVIANAQRVIDEVREMATTTYRHFIPISGGFLGIREGKNDN